MAMTSQDKYNMFQYINGLLAEPTTTREYFLECIEDQYKIDNQIFSHTILTTLNDIEYPENLLDMLIRKMGGISDDALDFALEHTPVDPTRLHWSVNNNLRLAFKLIDIAKLDVNAKDADGNTALHLAKNEKAVKFLMHYNASFSIKNDKYQTPIDTIEDKGALKALHQNISDMKKEKENKVLAFAVPGVSLIGAAVAGTIATLKINSAYNFVKDLFVKALGATNAKFFTPFVIATGALVGIAGAGLTAVAGKKAHDIKASGYTEALDKIDRKLAQFQTK